MALNRTVDEPTALETAVDLSGFRPAISVELEPDLAQPPQFRVASREEHRPVCVVPARVASARTNWGALLLLPFWTAAHGMWRLTAAIAIVAAVYIAFIHHMPWLVGVLFGVGCNVPRFDGPNGLNARAWRTGRYASAESFFAAQERWRMVGVALWVAFGSYVVGLLVAAMMAGSSGACTAG